MILRFFERALGRDGEAEDLAQEVFLRVFSRIARLRDPEALGSYIFSVAVRALRSELRRRRVRRLMQLSPEGELPDGTVEADDHDSREALRQFHAVLNRLSAKEREVFALRHFDGLKLEEIGRALGISLTTVKRRLERTSSLIAQAVEREPALADYRLRAPAPTAVGALAR